MNTGSYYNDKVVRQFAIMTVVWGIVGMLVGVLIAAQLLWPDLLPPVPWLTYSRLRPLHTNAVIFAFAGNAFFTGCYYSTQRLLKARMFSDAMSCRPSVCRRSSRVTSRATSGSWSARRRKGQAAGSLQAWAKRPWMRQPLPRSRI